MQNGLQIWNLEAKIHRLKKLIYVVKIQYYQNVNAYTRTCQDIREIYWQSKIY